MESYKALLRHVLENGEDHTDRTGVGTISVFDHEWKHDLRKGFPLLTTKRLPFRWIVEELRWFLSGSTNEKDLADAGVDIWKEWATAEKCAEFGRKEGDLGPVYGALWRHFPNGDYGHYDPNALVLGKTNDGEPIERVACDQITQLIDGIVNSPNSRRLIVSGWHPFYQSRVALPPCHTLYQVRVHEETKELSLKLYARSIDSFLGLPFNIASYALLTHMLAWVCGLTARQIGIAFGDLHIYKNHLDQVKEQLDREPHPLPTLSISPRLRDQQFDGIFNWTTNDVHLLNYNYHPAISAPVAV